MEYPGVLHFARGHARKWKSNRFAAQREREHEIVKKQLGQN